MNEHEANRLTASGNGLAGLVAVDALTFIAAVIDGLVPATVFEHLVREFGPPFASVLHPFTTV